MFIMEYSSSYTVRLDSTIAAVRFTHGFTHEFTHESSVGVRYDKVSEEQKR